MGIHAELYDFVASAGSFEGYVYHHKAMDPGYLPKWSRNLVRQYAALPEEVREDVQPVCDGTLGRAVRCLLPVLGDGHEVLANLIGHDQGALACLRG